MKKKITGNVLRLNWINIYVWYDIVSIFVNDMEWWLKHNIFKKRYTRVEIVRMYIVCGFDLRKYIDTLESFR